MNFLVEISYHKIASRSFYSNDSIEELNKNTSEIDLIQQTYHDGIKLNNFAI
jgi:hypothetical protein